MPAIPERQVLKLSLKILKTVFASWVKVERRQVLKFTNDKGQPFTVGKRGESDIGGWITKGPYIAKSLYIEVKRSDFRPTHLAKADKKRFDNQCQFMQGILDDGGVAFWVNNPKHLYMVLMPVLMEGAKVSFDAHHNVVVTSTSTVRNLN